MDWQSLDKGYWKKRLSPEEYNVLRKEGTEPAHSSHLNNIYDKGIYVCSACEYPLFRSEAKYDSGTGWPSFSEAIDGHLIYKQDNKLIIPRIEYRCARCGGHQGHVFNDGPNPTGKRYCNNGIALKFIASDNPEDKT